MAEKRKTAAEIRAEESQAWRDCFLGLAPTVGRNFERLLDTLRPHAGEAERLLALVLAEVPTLKRALQVTPEPLPDVAYVRQIVELAREAQVTITVGPIKAEPR